MKQAEIAERLGELDTRMAQIAELLQARVPPRDVRAHISESGETASLVADLSDAVPQQSEQLTEIVGWIHARMSGAELEDQLANLDIIVRQLISIMQGTRDDIVLLRGDFRRLAALCEQMLRARIDDEENGDGWDGFERRAVERRRSIPDRR
jgi:hypothetical protein